jgi:hypothetical protein
MEERDGVYAFQHYGIFKGRRMKHWREEWRRHPDGSFTQAVIGPFEDLRYTCTAQFQFNQWRCTDARGAETPARPGAGRLPDAGSGEHAADHVAGLGAGGEQRQAHRDGRGGGQRARLERVPPGGRGALSTVARVGSLAPPVRNFTRRRYLGVYNPSNGRISPFSHTFCFRRYGETAFRTLCFPMS